MLVRKLFSFLMFLQFPFIIFASNTEEDTSSNFQSHSSTSLQMLSKELIDDLDKLANPSLKTRDRIFLARQVQSQFLEKAPLFYNEPSILQKILFHPQYKEITQYVNASLNNLKLISEEYFTRYYNNIGFNVKKINFFSKTDGSQTGARMVISLEKKDDTKELNITYFIKTHQEGSQDNKVSTSIIDPKEVFVYKLFELIRVGPKSHFFSSNLSRAGVYIATQDVGYTKKTNKKDNISFETLSVFTKNYMKNVLHIDSTHKELFLEQKNIIDKDEILLKSVSTADLLARIFRLTDLTTNSGNYGFKIKKNEHSEMKLRIVDFRVIKDASYNPPGLYEGFEKGNGSFNYAFNNLLLYILKDRNLEDRKTTAKEILEELASQRHLKTKITEALEFTNEFFADNEIGVKREVLEGDLKQYVTDTSNNFDNLKNRLSQN